MASRPPLERGCSRVCVILLYVWGVLLIVAGVVAGGFIVCYPDILFYLAVASGSAIVVGILFVSLSACVCTRRRPPPPTKEAARRLAPPTTNGLKGALAADFKEASAGSQEELNGSAHSSRPSDGFLNVAIEKGEFYHNASVDVSNTKKVQQKPVTSSPRTTKAKMGGDVVFPEAQKVSEIPTGHRAQPESLRKTKVKNGKLLKAPASVGDFASLGLQDDDAVFSAAEKSKQVKGRGRVPLTAFKQTSKSVSDLDDESSFESTTRVPQQHTATRPETPQMEPRLAVSCHNILSEEPVRVGIAHLRQREDAVARKPPVPRKVTGIALPGMVNRPAGTSTSQSQDDLSRVRRKPPEPNAKPPGSIRDPGPESTKHRFQHKSVPDFFPQDGGAKLSLLDSSSSSYGKSSRTTAPAPETPLNTSLASYVEPAGPEDLHKCNTVGLPPVPPAVLPKPVTSGQQYRGYTPKEDAHFVLDKQPLMADWAASISSKSDTFSSDEAESQRQLSSSQELLMGSVKCLETEI